MRSMREFAWDIAPVILAADKQYPVRLLVCGGRDMYHTFPVLSLFATLSNLLELSIDELRSRMVIVEGGALGADRAGRDVAIELTIPFETFPANWDTHGKAAGFIRNSAMVEVSNATLAIWDGKSNGTRHSINLSNKKGIPLMINDAEIPEDLDTNGVINFLTRRYVCTAMSFDDDASNDAWKIPLADLSTTDSPVDTVKKILASGVKFNGTYSTMAQTGIWLLIENSKHINQLPIIGRAVNSNILTIRDLIIPKRVNYVYVKLDTGGFTGRQHGGLGEDIYPILRITIKVNDAPGLDLIINPGSKINSIATTARKIHEASGLLQEAKNSSVTIIEAQNRIIDYLREHQAHHTAPIDNLHTHLVGFNTDFIRRFLSSQTRGIVSCFSPKDIDINLISNVLELSGRYETMPLPQMYRKSPLDYLAALELTVKALTENL